VQALATLIDRLQNRTDGLPGMGCFNGPSGFGKTSAAIYATNAFSAVNVQVQSTWSGKFLCQSILRELGETPRGTIAALVQRISELLAMRDVPLLIDEADHLLRKSLIEIVREIYEGSQVPVVLIGEEEMPQKLRAWERVHNRMLGWQEALEADLQDVRHLAPIYARGVTIEEDLAEHLLQVSARTVRRICVNLDLVAEFARRENLASVDLGLWGKRDLYTGAAPMARRHVG
jgi:hypothetical protein